MPKRLCSIEGCSNVHEARGWCSSHYRRWKRHGDPFAGKAFGTYYPNAEASFLAQQKQVGDCSIWTGTIKSTGYGTLSVNDKTTLAHRYAWSRVNGTLTPDVEIDHICHEPLCVKRSHLRPATRAQNAQNRSGANSLSSSGYRNVSKSGSRYWVQLKRGNTKWFSTHGTLEEAVEVASRKREEMFGAFAGNG